MGTSKRWDPGGGFSFLEALFVVAVLGILLALAFPTYQRVVMERRVQNTTREIAGLLRAAQQLAVAKSADVERVIVEFQRVGVNEVTVRAVWLDPRQHQDEPDLLLRSGYTTGEGQNPMRLGVSVDAQASQLSFLPSGEASPAPFSVTVCGGGHTRRVQVNEAGLVTVTVPPPEQCSRGGSGQ